LYEMLTGRPPHTGETLPEVYDKVLNQEPMPPHQVRADVPQDLETITLKALDKDPSRRYATAAEFALDLRHAMDGEAIEARPESPARRFWRRTSRSWRLLVPALIAVVLGVGLGVAMARRSGVVLATV